MFYVFAYWTVALLKWKTQIGQTRREFRRIRALGAQLDLYRAEHTKAFGEFASAYQVLLESKQLKIPVILDFSIFVSYYSFTAWTIQFAEIDRWQSPKTICAETSIRSRLFVVIDSSFEFLHLLPQYQQDFIHNHSKDVFCYEVDKLIEEIRKQSNDTTLINYYLQMIVRWSPSLPEVHPSE